MDRAFIECQKIEIFGLDNEAFEHNYRVDITDGKNNFLPNTLQIGLNDSSFELQIKLDEEYNELLNDRRLLRKFIFPQAEALHLTICPSTISLVSFTTLSHRQTEAE